MSSPRWSERLRHIQSTTFGPPFDDDDADIILRSSDQVEFLVYKVILSKASPVFKTMFSLPHPSTDVAQDLLPIVDLTENSRVLATVLSAIYRHPLVLADPLSLDDLVAIFDTAGKYDMATASSILLMDPTCTESLRNSPFDAFCAAYSRELSGAAQIAARAFLKSRLTLDDIGDKLQYTSGPAVHRLWEFHRACSAAALTAIPDDNTFKWMPPARTTWWWSTSEGTCKCSSPCRMRFGPTKSVWWVNGSWRDYLDRARDALREHPCSEAVTNQEILRPSYEAPSMCDRCKERICGLSEFSRYLGEEVEKVVSEVREALALFFDIPLTFDFRGGSSGFAFLNPRLIDPIVLPGSDSIYTPLTSKDVRVLQGAVGD